MDSYNYEYYDANDSGDDVTTYPSVEGEDECASILVVVWYYVFPALVYLLLTMGIVLITLILIRLFIVLRKACPACCCCPPSCCELGLCHSSKVTDETTDGCRNDRYQVSLLSFNKHYYRIEDFNRP